MLMGVCGPPGSCLDGLHEGKKGASISSKYSQILPTTYVTGLSSKKTAIFCQIPMPSSESFKMGRVCKAFVRETLDDANCTFWLAIARQLPMDMRWDTILWRRKQIVQGKRRQETGDC